MRTIELGTKLTSINFDNIIQNYWNESLLDSTMVVDFSFKKLEWVGFEQLTFLTGWIDKLTDLGKTVTLSMQESSDILPTSDTYKKRERCLRLILVDWKIQSRLNENVKIYSGGINVIAGRKTSADIPFEQIPAIKYKLDTFEQDFSNLYKKHLRQFKKYSETEIKTNTALNYFDNSFLNYSIVKELYSNVCQHAFGPNPDGNKCYISLFFNKKIAQDYRPSILKNLLNARYAERPKEETIYFVDSDNNFTNKSYLEFTFLDFGEGISHTLRTKYNSENLGKLKGKLSSEHDNSKQNIDTRVLEYSFLLFTSKYEFSEDLKTHDYIPRGLYIVKDIVKRYKGLIIARSKKGKVVFDFSKATSSVHFRENDFSDEISDFPGTSITILLPAKESVQRDNAEFKLENEIEPRNKFVTILKLIAKSSKRDSLLNEKENEKLFYERFFGELCQILGDLNLHNTRYLVCFDFAGIPILKQSFYTKLTYFLSYSPLINENVNALFFNVLDKGINASQLEFEKELSSVGFFSHIIPCIFPDLTVNWIGIHDKLLSEKLLENWKGDNNYERLNVENSERIDGNVLKIFSKDGELRIRCIIPLFAHIVSILFDYQKRFIDKEINNTGITFDDLIYEELLLGERIIHNYNHVLKADADGRAYLTANGKYQMIFLSFIEKLYKKEYRRLVATYLLFNFFHNSKLSFDSKRAINKILTVTLSSQLLGKEVKDILEVLFSYKSGEIILIPLSSYYDFYKEQRFEELMDNDKILIVNDVVSTGYLSNRLLNSIKKRRSNVQATILTIVDGRQEFEKTQKEDGILALTEYPIEKIEPDKLKTDSEPIWINPILNAPITMSSDKSNIQNILLHPNEFLEHVEDESFYSVGLFKKNTVYHTYYLETEKLFESLSNWETDPKSSLLQLLVDRLFQRKNIDNQNNRKNQTEQLLGLIRDLQITNDNVQNIEESIALRPFSEALAEKKQETSTFDFVFYPFFSAISLFEDKINLIFDRFRGSSPIEIYPIPRIMTPKGWRFTFPPKFLNHVTKAKRVLILDDGSCSGETIVQMVDTISFLEVKEITVLSIFARLEDYNREFLTRINEMKVKNHTIPVTVYFGTHFNIPVYNRTNNPYSTELDDLNKYDVKNIPDAAKSYIEKRKAQIRTYLENGNIFHPLIPAFVSKKEMFRLRNILGRFDSYRLYKEDDPLGNAFDGVAKPTKEYLMDFISSTERRNALIAVLIHEPKLIETLYRVYPSIIKALQKELQKLFAEDKPLLSVTNKIFYLRALSYINIKVLLNPDIMLRFFSQMDISLKQSDYQIEQENLYDTFNYFAFILYCIHENKLINFEANKEENHRLLSVFVEKISNETLLPHKKDYTFQNLIREFLEDYRLRTSSRNQPELIGACIEMHNYFYNDLGEKSHPILFSKFQEFFIEYFNHSNIEIKLRSKQEYLGVLSTIRNKIIPRALIILKDFKPFKNYIFDRDFSVDEYIDIVKRAETNLSLLMDNRPDATDLNSPGVIDVYESFEALNNKILDYNSPFFMLLIKDFRFNPFELHKSVYKKENLKNGLKKKNIDFKVKYVGKQENIYILSHPIFFEVIYQEIPSNAIKYAEGAKCELTIKLAEDGLSLHYWQNTPKVEAKIGERGIRGFRKIAAAHNAKFEELNKIKYEFVFNFPVTLIS